MTDRELLELAAKAVGIEIDYRKLSGGGIGGPYFTGSNGGWNPLTDDGDALRLATELGLRVGPYPIYTEPKHSAIAEKMCDARETDVGLCEVITYRQCNDDKNAATRRAIVRAAAEIGKSMKEDSK